MKQSIIKSLRIGVASLMAIVLSGVMPVGVAFASHENGTEHYEDDHQVLICNASSSDTNPYEDIYIDTSAVDEENNVDLNGHGDHTGPVWNEELKSPGGSFTQWGDIIPPFYNDEGTYFAGQNWTEGQAIWRNGCAIPQEDEDEQGLLNVSTECEEITVSYSGIVPADGEVVVKDNDTTVTADTPYTATVGSHIINLYVNGVKVDTETVSVMACETAITPVICESPENGGIVTQSTAGWNLVGDAEFVDGGVEISSNNWVDGGVAYTGSYNVSEVLDLDWEVDTSGVSGASGVGIILTTSTGAEIHYEPAPYTDDFWTNTANILPANAGGQGGTYSGSLQDILDTAGDLQIDKTTFVFTSATANEVVLTSLSFNCKVYEFDKEVVLIDAPVGVIEKNDVCELVNDTYTIPATTGVNYYVDGSTTAATAGTHSTNSATSVTVTAQAQGGYELTGYPAGGWTLAFTDVPCDVSVIPATVTFAEVCGTEDDRFTIPATTGVTYKVDGVAKAAGTYTGTGTVTVTAHANEGYVLADNAVAQWSHTFTNVPCGNVLGDNTGGGQGAGEFVLSAADVVVDEPVMLADTGEEANPFVNLLVGLAIVAMALGSAILVRKQNA